MAHFAELNSSNEVLQVVVISNDDVDANGGDQSSQAETFVSNLVPHSTGGVAWKQTSYNNNFRKQYAGIGYTYDPSIGIIDGDETGVDSITFTIEKTPNITFEDPIIRTYGNAPFDLAPLTNDSPGSISYSVLTSPTVISITGSNTTINRAGTSIVSATIASSGGYLSNSHLYNNSEQSYSVA